MVVSRAEATGLRVHSSLTTAWPGVVLAVVLLHNVRSSSVVTWWSGNGTRLDFDTSTNYLTLSCKTNVSFTCGEVSGAGATLAAGAGRVTSATRLRVSSCMLREPLSCVPGATTVTNLQLENTQGLSIGLFGLKAVINLEIENVSDDNDNTASVSYEKLSKLPKLTNLSMCGRVVSPLSAGDDGVVLQQLRDLEVAQSTQLRELPAAALRPLPALAALSLWDNSIMVVHKDALQGATELKFLNLNNNALSSLPATVFEDCAALTDLHLSNNRLRTLRDSAFAGAKSLETVDLSYNEVSVLSLVELSGLQHLARLDLNHNRLRTVYGAYRDNRTQPLPLRTLNLSGNMLTVLSRSSLEGLLALQKLDLSDNHLTQLEPETFFAVRTHLTNLSVSGNGLVVECQEEPSPLRELTALRRLELARNNLTAVCADWRALPHLDYIDLSHNTIHLLNVHDLTWASPAIVDLNSNRIAVTIPARYERRPATATLVEVDLRHNLLTEVPRGLADSARALRLAGNPLRCECGAALPAGLRGRERLVLDFDLVTCRDDGERCDATGPVITVSALAAVAAVAGGVALLWYRSRRGRRREVRYDVFLSVAAEDAAWAWAAAVPALERGGRRVCVAERDWRPGAHVAAEGVRSVLQSWRTVAVWSAAAARCRWRRRELAAAVRLRRAVVLLREDAPPPPPGPHVVVRARDTRVWEKLRRAVR